MPKFYFQLLLVSLQLPVGPLGSPAKKRIALRSWMDPNFTTFFLSSLACFEENINLQGEDLLLVPASNTMSTSECQKLCNQELTCFYWTYNQGTKLCYLKWDITNWQTMYKVKQGTMSGSKRCCFNAGQAYIRGFATDEGNG